MNSLIIDALTFQTWADLCVYACTHQHVLWKHSLSTIQFNVVVIYELPTKVSE